MQIYRHAELLFSKARKSPKKQKLSLNSKEGSKEAQKNDQVTIEVPEKTNEFLENIEVKI